MKQSYALMLSLSAAILLFVSEPAFSAALDQCLTKTNWPGMNPQVQNKKQYCGCVLQSIAASSDLSASVKAYYKDAYSEYGGFTGHANEYAELNKQQIASLQNQWTPDQKEQMDQIEFIRLNCYSNK